jgi:uncharacterized protein YeaC (DUF1315 family)
MKKIVVNRQSIHKNKKNNGKILPVVICYDGEEVIEAQEMEIVQNGEVVASIVYRPDNTLSTGQSVWIETDLEVRKKSREHKPPAK